MRIADIAPLRRMPHHLNFFSYLIPEELEPRITRGSLVEIGIRGSMTTGLVLEAHDRIDPERKLQPIKKSFSITLPKHIMDALTEAAAYFAVTIPYLADALIPTVPKRWNEEIAIAPHTSSGPGERVLIEPGSTQEETREIVRIVKESCAKKSAVHILAPTLDRAAQVHELLKSQYKVAMATSDLSTGKLWEAFTSAARGNLDALITTRSGVLFPLANRGRFLILDEESSDHKQWDMKPRYDARTMTEMIAESEGSGVIALSLAPRLTTRARFTSQSSLPTIPNVIVHVSADMKVSMTQPTEDLIDEAKEAGKHVFILEDLWRMQEFADNIASADVVVSLFPDRLLGTKEWDAEERLHANMLRLTRMMKSSATLIIVATSAHRAFAGLLPSRREAYYAKLLEERHEPAYPPFGSFVKLIAQSGTSMADAKRQAETITQNLASKNIEVLGPYEADPPIVRGRFRALTLLHGSFEALQAIKPKLAELHDDILIDIDPDRIFR